MNDYLNLDFIMCCFHNAVCHFTVSVFFEVYCAPSQVQTGMLAVPCLRSGFAANRGSYVVIRNFVVYVSSVVSTYSS
jgi:hypothetical protein